MQIPGDPGRGAARAPAPANKVSWAGVKPGNAPYHVIPQSAPQSYVREVISRNNSPAAAHPAYSGSNSGNRSANTQRLAKALAASAVGGAAPSKAALQQDNNLNIVRAFLSGRLGNPLGDAWKGNAALGSIASSFRRSASSQYLTPDERRIMSQDSRAMAGAPPGFMRYPSPNTDVVLQDNSNMPYHSGDPNWVKTHPAEAAKLPAFGMTGSRPLPNPKGRAQIDWSGLKTKQGQLQKIVNNL